MLADKVVIVTGAAGNLGSAVVSLLAGQGARLVAIGRSECALEHVLGKPGPAGAHAMAVGVDLGDPAACAAAAAATLARFGHIDGLVNAAGGFAMAGIDQADAAFWEGQFRLNLITALNMCRAVVPAMREAQGGSIVNIGSAGAAKGGSGMAAYAAAKSAVLRLSESLADELKAAGIRVNCVLPSIIDTPQNRAAMPKADPTRWVTPAQLAEVIAFLLSDAASGVTGTGLPVTGRG